ncbi:hypothetical protein L195_g012090 [Trifolium pratense]|uniref:Structural constituent of ribosome protein n=1 Tax=Trifolium pratense TaxID=57577 RepID=A0A2K3PJF3_TRIPR|nr:hypothetical protein L195_g012090 [Trifolium pratense]
MALSCYSFITPSTPSLSRHINRSSHLPRRVSYTNASFSSSSPDSKAPSSSSPPQSVPSSNTTTSIPYGESRPPEPAFNHAFANTNGNPLVGMVRNTESTIERIIFDFRFFALLAVGVYWSSCVKGVHTGKMVLRLVEAIDVYLAGTVMLIFGMGLYGLFISNTPSDVSPSVDRALKGSSLFGMFALKERPKWMKISSLDELKTKVGHVIVMILLVKMFERSKMVVIATGLDLLSYSVCIFLSSASLYILHNLHKQD